MTSRLFPVTSLNARNSNPRPDEGRCIGTGSRPDIGALSRFGVNHSQKKAVRGDEVPVG
jgi:hypothetical protein